MRLSDRQTDRQTDGQTDRILIARLYDRYERLEPKERGSLWTVP